MLPSAASRPASTLCSLTPGGSPLQADRVNPFDFGSLLVDGVVAAAITLFLCGIFVGVLTEYTGRTTSRVHREPGRAFLYGFGILFAFVVVFVALFLTVVGILIAIPLAILFGLGFLIWGQLGFLAVARVVTDEKWTAVGVATVLSFAVGFVPDIGTLAGVVIGSLGVGAAVLDYRADDRPRARPRGRRPQGRAPRPSGRRPRRRRGRRRRDRRRGRGQRETDRDQTQRDERRERGQPTAERASAEASDDRWGQESDWGFEDESSEDSWGFDDDESWRTSGEEDRWDTEEEEDGDSLW